MSDPDRARRWDLRTIAWTTQADHGDHRAEGEWNSSVQIQEPSFSLRHVKAAMVGNWPGTSSPTRGAGNFPFFWVAIFA